MKKYFYDKVKERRFLLFSTVAELDLQLVITCGRLLDITWGRILHYAAAHFNIRPHVTTLTEGPIQPR